MGFLPPDQHVHGWDARRASHVTGFMAAPTSRCQLDLILFLVDSAASVEAKWGCHMNGDISVSWLLSTVHPARII
jgi:hypothetical protein